MSSHEPELIRAERVDDGPSPTETLVADIIVIVTIITKHVVAWVLKPKARTDIGRPR